ncbi:MAG: hypothetical protein KME21_14415 [Desmonostoc vinosum HA7617-LM4]|jgi:DNA-directed RNA polymerase subunit RPC12/RpoP|nr:hypothetical protein [Desmonostoc vinosum HA7617-LM4]
MKCINCGTDNKLKDRVGNYGRCIKCNHQFAFEPTSMGKVKITDPMFAKVIADLSVNDTLFFTPKQLLYFFDNRLRKKSSSAVFGVLFFYVILAVILISVWSGSSDKESLIFIAVTIHFIGIWILFSDSKSTKLNAKARKTNARALQILGIIVLVLGIFASIVVVNSFAIFILSTLIGMLSIYLGTRQLRRIGLAQEFLFAQSEFQGWLNRWQQINETILKILPSPREESTSATINPDVTAYSFDRLVVCDSATIAQLLIANNFHFENNCAILSVTGYPQNIFDTTMQMLRRNPELQVYAIHDCSPQGISLVHHLRTSSNWFLDSNVVIIDVGLTPRQIIATKRGMFIQFSPESAKAAQELSGEIRQGLSAEELQWLDSGNFVELESFTPQRLIQILQRGISNSRDLVSDDSSLILVGDTGNDMYVVQSFG